MLGLDQKAARATWTAFLIVLLIFLIYLARRTLIMFTLALFFAYMLWPLVDFVSRFVPKRVSRNLSLVIVYIVLLAMLVGVGFGIGSQVIEQGSALALRLPELVKQDPLAGMWLPDWLEPMRGRISETVRSQIENLDKAAFPLITKAGQQILAHADAILMVVLIPILSFFFLKDGHDIRGALVQWSTHGRNSVVLDEILEDVHGLLGQYIRALVLLSCATFVCYTLFLQFGAPSIPSCSAGSRPCSSSFR